MTFNNENPEQFDYLCKAEDLVIGTHMRVAGTMYTVRGLGFNGVDTVEIVLQQYADPLNREITIRADSNQVFVI